MQVERLSALGTGRIYPIVDNRATHFCYTLRRPMTRGAAGSITAMKNLNEPIGNRTRGLRTCSAVIQQIGLPRGLDSQLSIISFLFNN